MTAFLPQQADLFNPPAPPSAVVKPWRPHALSHEEWGKLDYKAVYAWRIQMLKTLQTDKQAMDFARQYYSTRPGEFIQDWFDTYNPRKSGLKWMPFVFFQRQQEFVDYLEELRRDDENGLVEKCRDIGATWLVCAYSVWCFLFLPDFAFGWGSRKQELVDKLGDPDSIFEKMRKLIDRLPDIWLPVGWRMREHATFMKLINPANGATITGESGDNIGRGGRKGMYGKDEAQPLNARILTPTGWKTMGDMRPGSLVIGANGQCRMVTHINDCAEYPVYRITLRDGTSVEASEGHLWNVSTAIGKRRNLTLRTSEIFAKYRYDAPGGQSQYRYQLPLSQPVQFFLGASLPLNPYVVGVLLGDGSVNSGAVSFTSADVEIVVNVAARLPEGCKVLKGQGGYDYRIVDMRGRMGNKEKNKSRARKAVKQSGIAGHLAHTKFIPEAYKFASIDDRLELLQGLMDTDVSASGGTVTYHTCSKTLADDVQFLVQSLGGVASLNRKPDHRGYRDMYCLHIDLPDYMSAFKLHRKQAAFTRQVKFHRSIVNVEYVGRKAVRCITVDASDGLYLTDHCIVTHNSAHYERPEKIEAALADNTNVQLDISSVNGLGNVFHRRAESAHEWHPGITLPKGEVRKFIFDWRDHPEKTQEWYDHRKAKAEREGMQHIFAQEVDRNYSAAVQNTIIAYDWLVACIDAHLKVPCLRVPPPNAWMAGFDVADEGMDRNALALRQWVILRHVEEWGERDPGASTRRVIDRLRSSPDMPHKGMTCQYDSIGVGATVKAEFNRLTDDGTLSRAEIDFIPWNAGGKVVNPYDRIIPDDEESTLNGDFFYNMKAQAWWSFRTRVYKTWRAVTLGEEYPADELVSFCSDMPALMALLKELAQPTRKADTTNLKMLIDKIPAGTRSPNMADSVIMAYFPAPSAGAEPILGVYR